MHHFFPKQNSGQDSNLLFAKNQCNIPIEGSGDRPFNVTVDVYRLFGILLRAATFSRSLELLSALILRRLHTHSVMGDAEVLGLIFDAVMKSLLDDALGLGLKPSSASNLES